MIFNKLIAALDRHTTAVEIHSRALSYSISPQMVHDSFASYLTGADGDLNARMTVVRDICAKCHVKEIAELTHDQFFEALEMLNEAS